MTNKLDNTQVASKVGAGAVGGSVALVLVWAAGLTGLEIPTEVGMAFGTILMFVFGWIAKQEQ
jgi:hypothetical protein